MADFTLHNIRIALCFLVIYHVHNSCSAGVLDVFSNLALDIYRNLGAANNDKTIIQERESHETSLMQEIKAGRHGRGENVHVYGRHTPGNRLRGAPLNFIDVRASPDDY